MSTPLQKYIYHVLPSTLDTMSKQTRGSTLSTIIEYASAVMATISFDSAVTSHGLGRGSEAGLAQRKLWQGEQERTVTHASAEA